VIVFFIHTNPMSIETTAPTRIQSPSPENSREMYSRFIMNITSPMPGGSMPNTQADMRPSAVSAATSRRNRSRCTIVSDTLMSSSAKLPPTSRWILIAMTAHSKSSLFIRSATASRASSRCRPRRASVTAWRSSLPIGSSTSFDTASNP
jgi:hypothetical protein